MFTAMCETDSWREPSVQPRELGSALCADLGEGGAGEREGKREGIHVYVWLIRVVVQQKLNAAKQLFPNKKKKNNLDSVHASTLLNFLI